MSDINQRLKKIEKTLKVGQEEQRVVEIVVFCDGELSPDHASGDMNIHYVRYEDIRDRRN